MKLLILLAAGSTCFASSYFVATTGSDTNPGTLDRPWRSIGKAAAAMVAGDSVLVRGGVYYESVNPARSGTQSDPITYAAYDAESVFIDGSDVVTGWVPDSGVRYRAIVSFTPDPRFTSSRDPAGNHGGLVIQDGAKMQYAMEASAAAVDSPGEYYMNDSSGPPCTLYACVRDLGRGTDPNGYEMRVGRRRKGFDLDGGEDWLELDGFTLRNYNDNALHSIGSTDCEFRDLALQTNFITGIYLTSNSNRCLIEKCAFWDNGHGGIELASTRRTVVRRNRFLKRDRGDGCGGNGAHLWLGPVNLFADSNVIENNLAFATGRWGYTGPFISVTGSHNIIRHNSVVAATGGAIILLDGGHNTVVNNACDISASGHGVGVFPNACRDSFHRFAGNCFWALDPFEKFWWDGVRYSSLAAWESASAQTGNIDSLPGFARPDSEDLHPLPSSACVDHGTADSAASEDFDGNSRPQGAGYDIGAYELPGVGIETAAVPPACHTSTATVVRGSLNLTSDSSNLTSDIALVDVSGRRVLDLRSGPNEVSALAPGVYFIQSRGAPVSRKILLTR